MKRFLGIELGSTRIKAVLIDENAVLLAKGSYAWENRQTDGLWSYELDDAWHGVRESYAAMLKDYGAPLSHLDGIGISGMMHGYLAFDGAGTLLAPFRTWRNTNAKDAAEELSSLFSFHVPMRWSVAQYYQSVLDNLPHVKNVAHLTTLAGYIHEGLGGEAVLGAGDASGMFPLGEDGQYDKKMLAAFNARLKEKGLCVDFAALLPKPLRAGERAGVLSEAGARLLDESGALQAGAPLCPPEGDMGTGMICTNCVRPRSANVSLGTSANLTVIAERPLSRPHEELDVVATPDGAPAVLLHTNTCTSVLDAWISLFGEVLTAFGHTVDGGELFSTLFALADKSDDAVGDVAAYNYLAGEVLAHRTKGCPMVYWLPSGKLSLANFMQAEMYSAIATLALGIDVLREEGIQIDTVYGHGGFFKTPEIGQRAVSALANAPVSLQENAGEGGAWGIAILALYAAEKPAVPLADFLSSLFASCKQTVIEAAERDKTKFARFMENYRRGLPAEAALCE